ncbi:MAG: cytochrome P450 [Waddliaceae bacterium]
MLNLLPFIGSYLAFFRDPISFFNKIFLEQGDVAIADFGILGKLFFIFHPDDIEQFFALGKRCHRKRLNKLFGNGLFTLETGEAASNQRKSVQECFSMNHLKSILSLVETSAQHFFHEHSRASTGIDVIQPIKTFTRKLQLALVFGKLCTEDECELLYHLEIILDRLNREFSILIKIPDNWPNPANRAFQKSLEFLKRYIEQKVLLTQSSAVGQESFGVLSTLAAIKNASAMQTLSNETIRAEALTLLIAGTETTSALIVWMLHLLSTSPDTLSKVKIELQQVSMTQNIQLNDLSRLSLNKQVVQETLRLYPVAWAIIRSLDSPLKTKNFEILSGSNVWAVPWITHRHPECWRNPIQFLPSRFEDPHGKMSKYAFFPFGEGGHRCVAQRFVMVVAQTVLAVLSREYCLETTSKEVLVPQAGLALMPMKSPRIIFRKGEYATV